MRIRNKPNLTIKISKYVGILFALLIIVAAALPLFFTLVVKYEQTKPETGLPAQFPVTVDPKDKLITENTAVNNYLEGTSSPLEANIVQAANPFLGTLESLLQTIAEAPLYEKLASISGLSGRLVTINPGLRKEQVAEILAKALSWNNQQKTVFLTPGSGSVLPLPEGSFLPGTYFVDNGMTPSMVQNLIDQRFTEDVLSHYGTSTAQIVPISEALTIASIIQKETIGNNDMRLVSGIIWNRLFANMNLQVDSTLQYAKANTNKTNEWWPNVVPSDKYIKSPYNTYLNSGLPPTPIASPSVGAILAALNPVKTSCLYYFSDKSGNFHCSDTYAEHVALLKKYY